MKIFSFDAETNGLYGQAFALAAVVTDDDGFVADFLARCPVEGELNEFWEEKEEGSDKTRVELLRTIPITHDSYESMLEAFYVFYMEHKEGAKIIAHMASPVETKILRDMIELDLSQRMWTGPFPLIDVTGTLDAKGFDPASVDSYNVMVAKPFLL